MIAGIALSLSLLLSACMKEKAEESSLQNEAGSQSQPIPQDFEERLAEFEYSIPGTFHKIRPEIPLVGLQSGDPEAVADSYAHPKTDLGLCLTARKQDKEKENADGTVVELETCNFDISQHFRISKQGYITALWTCMGFDPNGQSILMDCSRAEVPVFLFQGTQVKKKDSDECLALPKVPATRLQQLTLLPCNPEDPAQTWSFGKKSFESLVKDVDPAILAANAVRTPPEVDEVLNLDHNPRVDDDVYYSSMPLASQLFPTDGEWARYIAQSKHGDCSALTVVLSMALGARDLLFKTVYKTGPRSYQVHLFWNGRRVAVNVDDRLPLNEKAWNAAAPSADARTGQLVLYTALIEKALSLLREAKGAKSGYDNLIDTQAGVMDELLGVDSLHSNRQAANWNVAELETMILDGLQKKGVVVAAVLEAENSLGIPTGHAYSVIGISRSGSEAFVTIRNPWGFDGWKAAPTFALVYGDSKSVFTISLKDFVSTFSTIDIANLPDRVN